MSLLDFFKGHKKRCSLCGGHMYDDESDMCEICVDELFDSEPGEVEN
jgi:hypothetical protein